MKVYLLILATICIVNVYGQNNVNSNGQSYEIGSVIKSTPTYTQGNPIINFAWKLIQNSKQPNSNDNLVLSPILLQYLLAFLELGAAGETKYQLQQTIGQKTVENLRDYFISNAPDVELNVANGIFVEATKAQNVNSSFVHHIKSLGSRIFYADFLNQMEEVKKEINRWAADATYGQIQNLLGPSYDLTGSELILLSAIYFHNSWKYKFHSIGNMPFYKNADQKQDVEFMEISQWLIYNKISTGTYIELPYEHGNYSMIIIIPNDSVDNFIKTLNYADVENMIVNLSEQRYKLVKLQMPKFKINTKFSVVNSLIKMGLVDLFTSNSNLPYLIRNKLMLSDIVQDAALTVNEDGTIAAAAMASLLVPLSAGGSSLTTVTLNRPFISIIVDRIRNAPLIISKIKDIK